MIRILQVSVVRDSLLAGHAYRQEVAAMKLTSSASKARMRAVMKQARACLRCCSCFSRVWSKASVHSGASIVWRFKMPPTHAAATLQVSSLGPCLPVHYGSSIHVAVDEDRMDVLRVLILPDAATPYAHGAFCFDAMLPATYPEAPPKARLLLRCTSTDNLASMCLDHKRMAYALRVDVLRVLILPGAAAPHTLGALCIGAMLPATYPETALKVRA
jgi:Ubiquitin-conjugating enzyme